MQTLKGEVELSLNSDTMVTSVRSGNFLHDTRDLAGSQPSDRVVEVMVMGVKNNEETGISFKYVPREIDKFTFGHGYYDRLIEIYTNTGMIAAMIFWSTETGDYKVDPSTLSMNKNWMVALVVLRTGDAAEIVQKEDIDWANMSKIEKYDFVLSKFSELLDSNPLNEQEAFELATHKHYKGGLYRRLGKIRNADDGDYRTLYLHLHPHELSAWHRDTEEFDGMLNTGQQRFAPIEDELPFIINDDGQSAQVTVVLRRVSEEPISGVLFTEEMVNEQIPKLNALAAQGRAVGEFGQPKKTTGEIQDWKVCCQFTNFTTTNIISKRRQRVTALVAQVMPYGPEAMNFLDNMRKDGVGFAMRFFGDIKISSEGNISIPKSIIAFDFVANK